MPAAHILTEFLLQIVARTRQACPHLSTSQTQIHNRTLSSMLFTVDSVNNKKEMYKVKPLH